MYRLLDHAIEEKVSLSQGMMDLAHTLLQTGARTKNGRKSYIYKWTCNLLLLLTSNHQNSSSHLQDLKILLTYASFDSDRCRLSGKYDRAFTGTCTIQSSPAKSMGS